MRRRYSGMSQSLFINCGAAGNNWVREFQNEASRSSFNCNTSRNYMRKANLTGRSNSRSRSPKNTNCKAKRNLLFNTHQSITIQYVYTCTSDPKWFKTIIISPNFGLEGRGGKGEGNI